MIRVLSSRRAATRRKQCRARTAFQCRTISAPILPILTSRRLWRISWSDKVRARSQTGVNNTHYASCIDGSTYGGATAVEQTHVGQSHNLEGAVVDDFQAALWVPAAWAMRCTNNLTLTYLL